MLKQFIEHKISGLGKESVKEVDLAVFVIEDDYTPLVEYLKQSKVLYLVDDFRYSYPESVQIADLSIAKALIDNLPKEFCNTVVLDSPDCLDGSLTDVYVACALKGWNMVVVSGISQSNTFYNYNTFLHSRLNVLNILGTFQEKSVLSL